MVPASIAWIRRKISCSQAASREPDGPLGRAPCVRTAHALPAAGLRTTLAGPWLLEDRLRIVIPGGSGQVGTVLEIGAALMGTETELILKSRRVVPRRLLEVGFAFQYPTWPEAAKSLVQRWKDQRKNARAT